MQDTRRCKRCLQLFLKADLIGANVFDCLTGMHIKTVWLCRFCAKVAGLLSEIEVHTQ